MAPDSDKWESTPPEGGTTQRALTVLFEALAVVGAVLFVIGWSYGRAYYGAFGIGLNQLEIPPTSYLVWVQPLVYEVPIRLLVFPALLLSMRWWIPVLLSRFLQTRLWHAITPYGPALGVLWIVLMLLFYCFYAPSVTSDIAAEHTARDAHQTTTTLPKVQIQLKTPEGENNELFLDRLRRENISDGWYIFLGRHRGVYYLLPYRGATGMNPIRVLILPEDVVATLRVMED
jgi:hypothetical protein